MSDETPPVPEPEQPVVPPAPEQPSPAPDGIRWIGLLTPPPKPAGPSMATFGTVRAP